MLKSKVRYYRLSNVESYSKFYWTGAICCMTALMTILCYFWLSNLHDYHMYYNMLQAAPIQNGCTNPQTDPWDPSIIEYLYESAPLECKLLQNELTSLDDDGWLSLNESQVKEAGYGGLICEYRCFDRKENTDDATLDYGNWTEFKERVKPNCEFVEVQCRKSFPPVSVYSNLHSQIIPLLPKEPPAVHVMEKFSPNVILFVLDSVSQANWHRNLPETLKVLQDDYQAHVFKGFTKVADNSLPNAVAFLTGKRVHTVGYVSELPDDMSKDFSDDWPIIWKDFKHQNYSTFYAEDLPDYNLFYHLANGFYERPVDHYFRPFWLQLYGSFLHRRSTHLCYGNNAKHRFQLHFLKQFLSKYPSEKPKFALSWLTELGHDWMNQIRLGDEDIAEFFRSQKEALKDSFVFILSDHGHRFDPIRQSVIGRIEERMPFVAMHLPQKLVEKFPTLETTVRENTEKLTSTWDIYITLRDILQMEYAQTWSRLIFEGQLDWSDFAPRGLSLLRQLPTRDCDSAGIPDDFCVCQRETLVNVTDPKIRKAADQVIRHLNGLLKKHSSECAQLQLTRIHHAQSYLPNMKTVLGSKISALFGAFSPSKGFYINYRVTVSVSPSDALFEAVLRNSITDEEKFTVVGDVNRINQYGNQSTCVHTAFLRKYCYCI